MKTIEKVNKKAYKQIKQIMNAGNMLEVESAISSAILNTFGLMNIGLMKIAMRENHTELQKQYGCYTYNNNFNLMKSMRNYNFETYANDARKYLISFIPERMKSSEMYKRMISKY